MGEAENNVFEPRLSKRTRRILKRHGINIYYQEGKRTKTNNLLLYTNDDLLQYYGVVRSYVCAKYHINHYELEVLCALKPKGLFTKRDYDSIPKNTMVKFSRLRKVNFIAFYLENEKYHSKVYALSTLGKKVVADMHKYLLKPETIPDMEKVQVPLQEKKKFSKIDKLIRKLKTS